jgi:hypothetical protein
LSLWGVLGVGKVVYNILHSREGRVGVDVIQELAEGAIADSQTFDELGQAGKVRHQDDRIVNFEFK